jgi:GTPase involved in cell partitioning and DNA repair
MVHFGVNTTSANRTAEIVDITDLPTLISASNGAISFGSQFLKHLKQEIGFHHSSKIE